MPLPTLKEFLEKSSSLGIIESLGHDEENGECRCLTRDHRPPVFLPKELQDSDTIQAFLLAYLCRSLDIDANEFGFISEFAENPLSVAWEWD